MNLLYLSLPFTRTHLDICGEDERKKDTAKTKYSLVLLTQIIAVTELAFSLKRILFLDEY
jgi:hypothetical protein